MDVRTHHPHHLNDHFFNPHKNSDDLRETLIALAMELDQTKAKAQDQIRLRDAQISHLTQLLDAAIKDRNQALESYQKLAAEMKVPAVSSVEPVLSSSDCDESIVSSPPLPVTKPLPEKGKLLEAVVKAGPLLQNLLIAGPLPQWRHPPPAMDSRRIPPVPSELLQNNVNGKRGLCDEGGLDSSNDSKYQRLAFDQ